MNTALLLVDLQNDFFPGGALPTPEGNSIVEPANRLVDMFEQEDLPIFATRDWHPPDHCSFKAQGGPWPPHCVRNTRGAAFHPDIRMPEDVTVISKATATDKDAYSGFADTELAAQLRQIDVSRLVVAGLATDVCVKNTVLDALKEGLAVLVVREAVSGVEAEPGDSEKALKQMTSAGAERVAVDEVAARLQSK